MGITVEESFVRIDGKSFAIDKITSVEVRTDRQRSNGRLLAWLTITGALCVSALAAPGLLFVAVLTGGLAFKAYRNPPPRIHRLFLTMASQEAAACHSTDEAMVCDLRDRIELAMRRLSSRQSDQTLGRIIEA